MTTHHWTTRAIHAGRDDLVDLGLHAPPIDLSTTYPSRDTIAEAARLDILGTGADDGGLPVYGRVGNPTVARFERALAELEEAPAAVAFATGMAAMTACLLATVAQGRPHVVAIRPLYGTSDHLLASGLLGTSVTWANPEDVTDAIRPDTGLVAVETPGNPTLAEVDINSLAAACAQVPLLVDNTFATPALQRPRTHGAAIVLHSATKYLGGHGDVMGGVVACDEPFAQQLRQIRFATGGLLHPIAGYQLHRGLTTLSVRMAAASASGAELARRLQTHPHVRHVHYPGLDGQPRPIGQMTSGGAIVSFEVDANPAAVIANVRLITPAVSLGSIDSLIQHPASLSHHIMAPDARDDAGISETLLRLSVGLENTEDIWSDLDHALNQAH